MLGAGPPLKFTPEMLKRVAQPLDPLGGFVTKLALDVEHLVLVHRADRMPTRRRPAARRAVPPPAPRTPKTDR